jgi:hypothetical protein
MISNQCLTIPPDHALAKEYYDLMGLSNAVIQKHIDAFAAGNVEELQRIGMASDLISAELRKLDDEIRRERGADETCRVLMTYNEHGFPVVNGRFQLLPGGRNGDL